MTKKTKYTLLRNIVLICMCGFLAYSVLPFPPYVWRFVILFIELYVITTNLNILSTVEKTILFFWLINILYFFTSYLWVDKIGYTQIGNISVTLLAFPMMSCFARNGVLTNKFYNISVIALVVCANIYFINMEREALANIINDVDDTTNNASSAFLFILPFIFILNKRWAQYLLLLICTFFLLDGSKRGNIVCAIPVIIVFIYQQLKNKKIGIKEKIIFIIFLLFTIYWSKYQVNKNEYLLERIEKTAEGDSSNRDVIYSKAWDLFANSENIKNFIFGHGFDATIHHPSMQIHAHNDWLEILVNYGLIGAINYLLIFILLFKHYAKENNLTKRSLILSASSIWILKSAFSMGFTDNIMFIMFLALAYCFTHNNQHLQSTR